MNCPHCHHPIEIRNPSGYCDHLYYPDYCKECRYYQSFGKLPGEHDPKDPDCVCPDCIKSIVDAIPEIIKKMIKSQ